MAEVSGNTEILPASICLRWVDDYVGIPHLEGGIAPPAWDCYGCLRYVLALHAAILLPADPTQIDRSKWKKVEGAPQTFDIAEMRARSEHVGMFVSPERILHCEESTGTVCVPRNRLRWPVRSVWRHESLI